MAKKLAFDKWLFTTVVVLVVFGLVMVYSAAAPTARGQAVSVLFLKQAIAALFGAIALAVAMHVDYRVLARPALVKTLVFGSILMLTAVLFQGSINGTRRWFLLGPISIQASELAKLAVIPFLAFQIDRRDEEVSSREFLLPTLFVLGLMAALILAQPDLGTTALLLVVAAILVFVAGLSLRFVLGGLVAGGLALAAAIAAADYRRARLFAFLDPEKDPLGSGYQALQSLIAVGSGGLFGRGPGDGVQKLYYLPHPESDFIFSIVGEELGLVGSLFVLALFGVLLWRGVEAGLKAPDRFGRYLAFGITSLLVMQALINIGVALALLPTKGIPLPFISYGGTSLVVAMALAGVLLNISEHG